MIVSVPFDKPDTAPVPVIVPTNGSLLLHTPPAVASLNVAVVPEHIGLTPVMAAGTGLTVTGVVRLQPPPSEYVIVADPSDTPVTTPVSDPTAAIAVLLLLHRPVELVLSEKTVVPYKHTGPPVTGAGSALATTVVVAVQPPSE
jgi:hypothetical protein